MLLAVQAMTPNAIAEHFSTSRQAVSKHIQILSECGMLDQNQAGREIRYQIKGNRMQEIEKWLDTFKSRMAARFNQLDDVLNQMKARKK